MPIIRQIEIYRFRGIREAVWRPKHGINAIIGSGDNGKSTILDAIEMVMAPRRNITFTDADFWMLDVSEPIDIRATIGELPDPMLDLERYGMLHRGWHPEHGLSDEPTPNGETVITIRLTVDADLEPRWCLFSDRAEADDHRREIPSTERNRLAPTRLGMTGTHHLAWGARSILNKLAAVPEGTGSALAAAAREARSVFGGAALGSVENALEIVRAVATRAGVTRAAAATALLDVHGISLNGGSIALHDEDGVPLRNLGTGSARLLVAALQAEAGDASPILLIDEIEHGLEPHRIIRLLHTLGSKDEPSKRQVFLTTHSAVVVRELTAAQLWRAGRGADGGMVFSQASDQATLRACAEAFLAPRVIVCEGATEIGLLRGLNLYRDETDVSTLATYGAALADGHGGSMISRACTFGRMGYATCLLRDCDVVLPADQLASLVALGVEDFHWDEGLSTEQQLCLSLPLDALPKLVAIAVDEQNMDKVEADLTKQDPELSVRDFDYIHFLNEPNVRASLGMAAKKGGWFKNITLGERVGREILGPDLATSTGTLPDIIAALDIWVRG
ncbi:ATP-dependent nuclease [Sphingomonas sp. UYP23]